MNTIHDVTSLLKENEHASKPDLIRILAEACIGWPYVFGAAGELCTPGNRRKFAGYHPEYKEKIFDACLELCNFDVCRNCKWRDSLIFDCRGFTRWLLKQVGIPLYGGGATTQWNTASNWVYKGPIDKLPTGMVCCLFKRKDNKMSHTGMYLGENYIIHCSTTVKRDSLPGTPKWTHFGIPAGLYSTKELKEVGIEVSEEMNTPTLRRGDSGWYVEHLQNLLNGLGWHLDIDGKFGADTEKAVKSFQASVGLKTDGICGPKTWLELFSEDIPGETEPDLDPDDGERVTIELPRNVANWLFEALGAVL